MPRFAYPSYGVGGPLSTLLSPIMRKAITCLQSSCSKKPIRNSAPKVLIVGDETNGHSGILYLHGGTKRQTPRRKAGVQYKASVHTVEVQQTTLIGQGRVGTLSKPQVPRCQPRASLVTCQQGFKDSDFGPALLTFFCTDTNPFSKSYPHIKVATSNSFIYLIICKGLFKR